jgi:hypothetical protein
MTASVTCIAVMVECFECQAHLDASHYCQPFFDTSERNLLLPNYAPHKNNVMAQKSRTDKE